MPLLASLIPWPYKIMAAAALAVALFVTGWIYGAKEDQESAAYEKLDGLRYVIHIGQKQQKAIAEVEKKHVAENAKIKDRQSEVTREVIQYAKSNHGSFNLDYDWLRIHNFAASGLPSDANSTGQTNGDASGVEASEAIAIVTENYGTCQEIRQQLIELQDWIRVVIESGNTEH